MRWWDGKFSIATNVVMDGDDAMDKVEDKDDKEGRNDEKEE
jgi:hypothetical protein